MPDIDQTSSPASHSSVEAQRERIPKAEETVELKAPSNQLNEHQCELTKLKQHVDVSSGHSSQPRSCQPLQQDRKVSHDLTAEALVKELEHGAYMEAGQDGRHFRRPTSVSYLARDDDHRPLGKLVGVEDAASGTGQEGEPLDDAPENSSQLNYVPWNTFYSLRGGVSQFAIDVLVGEPEPNVTMVIPGVVLPSVPGRLMRAAVPVFPTIDGDCVPEMTDNPIFPAVTLSPRATHAAKTPGRPAAPRQAPLPDRIRINSPAVMMTMDIIMDRVEQGDGEVCLTNYLKPILMMQPFRALVYHKDKIREQKAKLEAAVNEKLRASITGSKEELSSVKGKSDTINQNGDASKPDAGKPMSTEGMESEEEPGKKQHGIHAELITQTAVDDMACLVAFLDNEIEVRMAYLASNDCQRITFSDIWFLFKPGEVVCGKDGKQAYRVITNKYPAHCMKMPSPRDCFRYGAKARREDSPINIECVYIDYDGKQIGPVVKSFYFYHFEGEKNIRSLDIIPLRLAKSSEDLAKTLIERGGFFIEACTAGRQGIPMHYSGLTMDTKEQADSQVVIDFEEAIKSVTSWKPDIKEIDVEDNDDNDDTSNPSYFTDSDSDVGLRRHLDRGRVYTSRRKGLNGCIDECCAQERIFADEYVENRRSNEFIQLQFRHQVAGSLAVAPRPLKEVSEARRGDGARESDQLIVTYRVFGFVMRSRKWTQLDLTHLERARGENTFDRLVLPPGHRTMVESLVTQHYLDKEWAVDESDEMDIVRGKECVAEYFQKPLFQLTCGAYLSSVLWLPDMMLIMAPGDLGSAADVVEHRLKTNFALASRWGCILLIDEADVFLEARQTENFDRNALVAVFLRTLEYYTGILFLTTNRVGTFDEAFTSRIHVSLYYPPLDARSTLAVFKVNLDRIEERFKKKKQRSVAELDLDHRSIKQFALRYFRSHDDARWNGRQIRNACQTALALAQFEAQKKTNPGVTGAGNVKDMIAAASSKMIKVKMTAKHFHPVSKAYLAFIEYLKDVHGMGAAQQAKNFRLRHDLWEPQGLGGQRSGLGSGSGLLASRQRGPQRSVPAQRQYPEPVRRGMQESSFGLEDEYRHSDEGFGKYGYSEEHGFGDGYGYGEEYGYWGDDAYEDGLCEYEMLYEGQDHTDELGHESEDDGGAEHDGDAPPLSQEEVDQATKNEQEEYWNEEFKENQPSLYERTPKNRLEHDRGGGRGPLPGSSRGEQQVNFRSSATGAGRGRGGGRGRGQGGGRGQGNSRGDRLATASGGVPGPSVTAGRGDASRLGPRPLRGAAIRRGAGRGQGIQGRDKN
ncbi:ATPase, AAA-type, core [Cordyceps fumosorosea ARSEF 2679]|uniref:ATPase, AAA-type, core n=1 Tax=Cordyceps fumosorosea (strain ARSEF 2679) TaxID=1081104 RepID=A0A167PPA5_CORFA|nr:ATPase, AAA-type, core [Cordyceps fumosorosea ARSEF 2679]OAA56882.1 ATPase, AAA-type, core [Cordyceps fumosorosea ARSEF 2679]